MDKKFMRFPEGKKKVFTLSYDDNVEEDERLILAMEKHGVKGTFNLIPGWFSPEGREFPEGESYRLVSESQAKKIYSRSCVEIANHGDCHKFMTTLSTAEMAEDILLCRRKLETMFGRIVRGMAYPYGWTCDKLRQVLAMCGIVYCRTVDSTLGFDFPSDWLYWHPSCHHDDPKLMELAEEFIHMDPDGESKMFYVWGHTFEFENNNNWDVIERLLSAVGGRDDIWYATNMEIYEYVQAFQSLDISVDGRRIVNPTKIPLWVEIDGGVYKIVDELVF